MEELRQSFIADSTDALRNLQTKLQQDRDFSADAKREVFRALHTIKGTAQTFGFTAAAGLAHTLENLLAAAEEKDAARGRLRASRRRKNPGLVVIWFGDFGGRRLNRR
jgi:chemotaxis protein histidine kinase CheA